MLDPHVKSFPPGIQDTVWGASTCLRGQLGLVALFHDALNAAHVNGLKERNKLIIPSYIFRLKLCFLVEQTAAIYSF